MERRNSLQGEKLITLQTACDILRKRQPEDASRLHVATVYRWASKGIRGQRLETEHHGSKRFTSAEAIERFITRRERDKQEIETAVPCPRQDWEQRMLEITSNWSEDERARRRVGELPNDEKQYGLRPEHHKDRGNDDWKIRRIP